MKKLKLQNINAIHAAHVCALLYVPIGVIYLVIGAGLYYFTGDIMSAIPLVAMGVLLPLIGWGMVWIMTLLVNLALKIVGGVTFTFTEE